jgi:hypothetical protein
VWRYGILAKWQGVEFKRLERNYHATVRKKKRAYHAQTLKLVVNQKKSNPQRFWKTFRGDKTVLPDTLRDVSAWDSYIQCLARGLGNEDPNHGLSIEAYPPNQVPQAYCDDLNAPFTVEEIDVGLRALANGKSPGKNGFLAELFRYAQPPMPREVLIPQMS